MADSKLADLTSGTAAATDIIYAVKDPAGTPLDRKIPLSSVKDYITGSPNTFTDNQTISGSLTINGGTLNGTVLDISQTWGGTGTYTGLRYNVVDSGPSNAASLLMDLQVGGSSAFNVSKGGSLKLGRNASGTNVAASNVVIAGSQGTGTGAGGSIIFQVAPAGLSGPAQNALADALTIDSTRLATFALAAAFPGGSTTTLPIQLSAATYGFYRGVTQGGQAVITTCGGTDIFAVGQNSGIGVVNAGPYSWASTIGSTADLLLHRDAANTLALRNSTNAQTFRSYRSFTDASNYSRLALAWNTSTALVMAEGAGTGSDGSVAFNDAALATNATVGFVMIPSCAGAPSGTPADIPTGQIPMVWDSTNLKLYVYTGGAWKSSAAFT